MNLQLKKRKESFAKTNNPSNFASAIKTKDSVAQLVEQMTLNHWVESSSLSGVTKCKINQFKALHIM